MGVGQCSTNAATLSVCLYGCWAVQYPCCYPVVWAFMGQLLLLQFWTAWELHPLPTTCSLNSKLGSSLKLTIYVLQNTLNNLIYWSKQSKYAALDRCKQNAVDHY